MRYPWVALLHWHVGRSWAGEEAGGGGMGKREGEEDRWTIAAWMGGCGGKEGRGRLVVVMGGSLDSKKHQT